MSSLQVGALSVKSEKNKNSQPIPSLNGLRAISVALVLLGHLSQTRGFGSVDLHIGDYAALGVNVFFVISGFLITTLLMAEHSRTGTVSLSLFYARRSLRIFPVSYAYIACIYFLNVLGVFHLQPKEFWHASTYTVNFAPGMSWPLAHLWSLSVEEQFYLLWPFAFVILGARRAIWIAVGVVALGPLARIVSRVFLLGTDYRDLHMFPMVADSLAIGCLLAQTREWLESQTWYLGLFRAAYSLPLLALILVTNRLLGYTLVSVFGTVLMNLCIAILIHRSVFCSTDVVGRFLNWKPVTVIGLLSYSLYVWQQLFINRNSSAWMCAFPQNFAFTIMAASASYFLLEMPIQAYRHRLRVT